MRAKVKCHRLTLGSAPRRSAPPPMNRGSKGGTMAKVTISPETIAEWQNTGGTAKGQYTGGPIKGGVNLAKRFAKWLQDKKGATISEAEIEAHEAWQAAYPSKPARARKANGAPRAARGFGRESFPTSDFERHLLTNFRLLSDEDREQIANDIEAKAERTRAASEIERLERELAEWKAKLGSDKPSKAKR